MPTRPSDPPAAPPQTRLAAPPETLREPGTGPGTRTPGTPTPGTPTPGTPTSDDPTSEDPPRPVDDPAVTAVMSEHVVAITPGSSVATALRLMAAGGVRHLPVVEGRRCEGVVVEGDLVRWLASGPGPFPAAAAVPVGELCRTTEPVSVRARRSEVASRMRAEGTDVVLVADGGRLRGIVTATDLVRSLAPAPLS
jgi:CBS domain-containing protein